jgi:hypothetical protein
MSEDNTGSGPFINDAGYEVPRETIVVVPYDMSGDGYYKDIILPLKGETKRDWFNPHYYYCLPINIGNQYGFVIRSQRDFEMTWDGSINNPFDISFTFLDSDSEHKQTIKGGFGNGVVTVQNHFYLKTPPNINLMTIQPPNLFITGCAAMTGVVETDNIRRDFTFNLKITIPNFKIVVKKGDALGAFIPIQRGFVDNFTIRTIKELFSEEIYSNELKEVVSLTNERLTVDTEKAHESGRRYFNGLHFDNKPYENHQKRLV